MRLAVSNIAWSADEDRDVAIVLAENSVDAVELAPTKVFAEPTATSAADRRAVMELWQEYGIEVVAFQSMLFGRPDLTVFDDPSVRARTLEQLTSFIELAGSMGVGRLVFGSPANRRVPSGMSSPEADDIATAFFGELGRRALESGTVFCIEPNPEAYSCNYVTTAAWGEGLVRRVGSPGFGLHLDAAGMTLAGDDLGGSIRSGADVLRHFHASAPFLGRLEADDVDHGQAAAALRDSDYTGIVSIEMRPGENEGAADRVAAAVALADRFYRRGS